MSDTPVITKSEVFCNCGQECCKVALEIKPVRAWIEIKEPMITLRIVSNDGNYDSAVLFLDENGIDVLIDRLQIMKEHLASDPPFIVNSK